MKKYLKRLLLLVLTLFVLYLPVLLYNFSTYALRGRDAWILRDMGKLHAFQIEHHKKTGSYSFDLRDFTMLNEILNSSKSYVGFSENCIASLPPRDRVIFSFDLPGSTAEWDYDVKNEKPVRINEVPGAREKISKIMSKSVACLNGGYTLTWMQNRPERPNLTGVYRIDQTGQGRVIQTMLPSIWQFYFGDS